MNDNSQLLSHDMTVSFANAEIWSRGMADGLSSLSESVNPEQVDEQCNCSNIHMSSHNAICIYCSQKEKAGLSGFAFD